MTFQTHLRVSQLDPASPAYRLGGRLLRHVRTQAWTLPGQGTALSVSDPALPLPEPDWWPPWLWGPFCTDWAGTGLYRGTGALVQPGRTVALLVGPYTWAPCSPQLSAGVLC